MKINLFLFFFLFAFCILENNIFAQKFKIKGIVKQVNDSSVYSNISLFYRNTFFAGAYTADSGKFELENITKGTYFIIVSSLGFKTDTIFIKKLSKDLDVGTIFLEPLPIALNEVKVSAKYIINENGIKYVLPTYNQMKSSTNGIMLLEKINLPRLQVDGVSNTIQISGGGQVQLRINGREVSTQDVSALQPDEIIRIEYHDKPEARYDFAAVVLDYIVKHRESGGYIYTEIWNGLLTKYGEDRIVAKINYKKSEFSASYNLAYRDWKHLWRENHETFNRENDTITRYESGKPAGFEYFNQRINMNYNYQDGNKLLNVSFTAQFNNQVHKDWKSELYSSASPIPVSMVDSSQNKLKYPSLNIYYQHPLNTQELLIFNIFGLYNTGSYNRLYKESHENMILTNLTSNVGETQYTGGFSFLYENKLKAGTLNIGLKERTTLTQDNYNDNNSTYISTLDLHNLYLYTQFGNQIKKWYYRIGIGISENWQIVDSLTHRYIYFRPSLTLVYTPSDSWEFDYSGSIYTKSPSLSALSSHDQYIDSLQIQRGNPALKPQIEYYNAVSVDYTKKNFGLSYSLSYSYFASPLMENSYLENNMVIRTIENQKQFQIINTELELREKLYKDIFTIKIYSGINHYISDGNTYEHVETIFYYGGKVSINYKKFAFSWSLNQNTYDSFWGETLTRGESAHMVSLSYNTSNFYIGLDCLNMFSIKYIGTKDSYSAVAPYSRYEYLSELKNLIRFKITYTFKYGKEYKAKNTKNRNSDDTESGILKGEK